MGRFHETMLGANEEAYLMCGSSLQLKEIFHPDFVKICSWAEVEKDRREIENAEKATRFNTSVEFTPYENESEVADVAMN